MGSQFLGFTGEGLVGYNAYGKNGSAEHSEDTAKLEDLHAE